MADHPHFNLQGAAVVNGKPAIQDWACSDVFESGKLTIVAVFPSSHTPVCQATCLALSAAQGELVQMGAQAFGICNNYLADIAAWVAHEGITMPVISDFETRTVTATLAGLNRDCSARRVTIIYDGAGNELWRYSGTDNAQLHAEGALEFLRSLHNRQKPPQGAAGGDLPMNPTTETRDAAEGVWADGSAVENVSAEPERYGSIRQKMQEAIRGG